MQKALNLDNLVKERRTITVGGTTYAVVDMTVENYIATTKRAQDLGDNPSDVDQMESYVDLISRFVPEFDVQTIRSLSVEQLTTILKFVNGQFDEEKSPEPEDKPAKGKKSGK